MPEEKSVKLAVAGNDTHTFDPSIKGVEIITQEGTNVPAGKEEEVRTKARENGVSLRVVK